MDEDPDELLILAGVQNLRRHLAASVTTVRNNGARNRVGFLLREGVKRGYLPAPRMLVCGRPITCTGGHMHWCNGVADGEMEIRGAVRRLVHEGADLLRRVEGRESDDRIAGLWKPQRDAHH
jgi:imidazolonepropionase-like amidohydrolase